MSMIQTAKKSRSDLKVQRALAPAAGNYFLPLYTWRRRDRFAYLAFGQDSERAYLRMKCSGF
jgi:hypothetical protein